MVRQAMLTGLMLLAALGSAPAQRLEGAALREALAQALEPVLPFPDARPDGLPATGGAQPLWAVRWAEDGEPRVEVLANPLNDENQRRALEAEQAIQKAAMQAQRRSQSDYDQALLDFARTGRTSEIREVTLSDEGVAGERYDAESQLTIVAELVEAPRTFHVATGSSPAVVPSSPGAPVVVRVPANTYVDDGPGGLPGAAHYCAEQAWVLLGDLQPAINRVAGTPSTDLTFAARGASGRPGIVIWIQGNAGLVEQVVTGGRWAALAARLGA